MDLCLRIAMDGKDCLVAHDSVVEHVKSASSGRKRFNEKNFKIFNQRWGEKIRKNQSFTDQHLHAWTYFYRAWSNLGQSIFPSGFNPLLFYHVSSCCFKF